MQELASFVITLHSWFVIDDSYFLSSFILAAFLKHSDFVWGIKKIGSPPNLLIELTRTKLDRLIKQFKVNICSKKALNCGKGCLRHEKEV